MSQGGPSCFSVEGQVVAGHCPTRWNGDGGDGEPYAYSCFARADASSVAKTKHHDLVRRNLLPGLSTY
jgi:hypothetical protein